ncbi:DUF3905 domain-containing protein [Aneurinibacillus sp. Ricciae_BoGa-3]|uniref:DUF3905 domain-containing protein n=1 Tax=Aneurinibacillus sp. Ricciae_BoGa-3 TaxID=3022697 RepID=UPI002340D1C8|nr:DUF3905 domain-containing protein [Aneurinibacillus sp. Ricciae_BoGa-3]WCK54399.1 DUF3905 domain-containing protein [Aneurinibacillus sp. Ricciae_BoGa-3]
MESGPNRQGSAHSKKDEVEAAVPHQMRSPEAWEARPDLKEPFVNEYGVVIGDNFYDSPQSPLNNWSKDADPAIMAGDQWVHPTNDIGWNTAENQELLKEGILPQSGIFMHPTKDVSYRKD